MDWKKEKEQYCKGWHTWNNDSIMSYICPLDGRGIRLCIKDYKNAAFLENVLIGDSDAKVIPLAHAYDDSFTHVIVEWKDNHFEVYVIHSPFILVNNLLSLQRNNFVFK